MRRQGLVVKFYHIIIKVEVFRAGLHLEVLAGIKEFNYPSPCCVIYCLTRSDDLPARD